MCDAAPKHLSRVSKLIHALVALTAIAGVAALLTAVAMGLLVALGKPRGDLGVLGILSVGLSFLFALSGALSSLAGGFATGRARRQGVGTGPGARWGFYGGWAVGCVGTGAALIASPASWALLSLVGELDPLVLSVVFGLPILLGGLAGAVGVRLGLGCRRRQRSPGAGAVSA